PLIGAVAYTFGGLATDARSRVLGRDGPLPGLFAAGEITGHFWGTAPNAVSVLRALVFGRTAGREAISYLGGVKAGHWPPSPGAGVAAMQHRREYRTDTRSGGQFRCRLRPSVGAGGTR